MKKLWKEHKFILLAIPLAVVVFVIILIAFRRMESSAVVRESVEAGDRYLSELDYDRAIASYRQALDIDPKNVEVNLKLAEAYDANQMYAYAEAVYKSLLDERNVPSEAYVGLAELYLQQDRLEEAKVLLEEAMDRAESEEIALLYEATRPKPPTANYEEGAYSRRIRVELASSETDHTIYYTLDGTEPDADSAVYGEPLILRNGITVVKAVAVNALGYRSDVAAYTYDVQIEPQVVTLEEPVIERIIRNKLNIPYQDPIYNDDIEQITQIYIVGNGVQSGADDYSVYLEENQYSVNGNIYAVYGMGEVGGLNDLRLMPFLERVVVEYQPGLDISALADCPEVRELSLVGDGLEDGDIETLGWMTQLVKLNLGWNNLEDISGLAGLVNLESLGIWGNRIRSIQAAGGLSRLTYFDFSDNMVSDISYVAGLAQLKQLWMYRNQVADLSPVAGLEELQVLMVRDNPLANPEAVRGIYPHLNRLDVDLLGLGQRVER